MTQNLNCGVSCQEVEMKIEKEILNQIIEHCKSQLPKEACGILAGRQKKVEKVYRMKNVSDNPESCYLMEPLEQLMVFKEIRAEGMDMVGIYHSHYRVKAFPSQRDVSLAFYPEAVYVIVSLQCPGQEIGEGIFFAEDEVVLRGFEIIDGKISEVKISL